PFRPPLPLPTSSLSLHDALPIFALEFGYDSPDSFTKAFTRFHGLTPAALRKSGGAARSFAPLRIKVTLEGGQNMDCRIMKKEAFTVLCRAKTFQIGRAHV